MVGAGAVVVKDVPPYSIHVGVPAREIGHRFEATDQNFLLRFQWWKKDMKWLRANATPFDDIKALRKQYDETI